MCQNLTKHRVFTKKMDGIIYRSNQIIEDNSNAHSIKKLEGKKIKLPNQEHHFPGQDYLKWHRDNCFKG